MIEATRYEHEVYHHGYLNVIDPWKRTKNSVLFRQFIGARIRGAYTAGLPKKPYAIKLWNSNREGKNVSVLGLMKDENLILDAMYNDKARMRNRLCYDIWNQIDSLPYEVSEGHSKVNGTQGRYVEVFVDGAYNGVYCITDKKNSTLLKQKATQTANSNSMVCCTKPRIGRTRPLSTTWTTMQIQPTLLVGEAGSRNIPTTVYKWQTGTR